jgi:hypothetical protein
MWVICPLDDECVIDFENHLCMIDFIGGLYFGGVL